MVRVLLVRHAQSMQNAYMEGVAAKISRGELAPTELNKAMRDAPENMDAGADAPLTAKGAAQAELLGGLDSPNPPPPPPLSSSSWDAIAACQPVERDEVLQLAEMVGGALFVCLSFCGGAC